MFRRRPFIALAVLGSLVAVLALEAGATDGYVFTGAVGGKSLARVTHPFDVPVPSELSLVLRRSDPTVPMTFALRDPSGTVVARGDATLLEGTPFTWKARATGTWRVSLRVRQGRVQYELRVDVVPLNRAPVAADDLASAVADQPVRVPVLENDGDPDGDALAVARVGAAAHGQVDVVDPATVAYVAEPSFAGEDAFTYEVCDAGRPVLCASATVHVQVSAPSPSPAPDVSRTTSVMPLVKGLSTRWSYSRELPAYIQRVSWAELQPTPYGPIVHPNPIDQAIARGVPFRVRLLAGAYAPQWVMDLGSVTVTDTFLGANQTYVVPRWWTSRYAEAYADLIAKLAAEYDGRIPAITMSGPMTVCAEPFLHQLASSATREAVLAAGWSTAAERAAFQRMIDAHTAFRSTRTFMAINPGQTYDPTRGRWNLGDLSYMRDLTDYFVATLGRRAIVQNNSLNVTRATRNETYMAMYDYMKQLHASGVPIAFQTAQTSLVEDLPWVLDYAVAAGAHLVELPAKWDELDTPEHLAQVDQLLRANEP